MAKFKSKVFDSGILKLYRGNKLIQELQVPEGLNPETPVEIDGENYPLSVNLKWGDRSLDVFITENQLEDITENQLEDITENQLEDITENQLEDIPENQLEDIPENQLEDITENQLEDTTSAAILAEILKRRKKTLSPTEGKTLVELRRMSSSEKVLAEVYKRRNSKRF